jgi:hypothetical protein
METFTCGVRAEEVSIICSYPIYACLDALIVASSTDRIHDRHVSLSGIDSMRG